MTSLTWFGWSLSLGCNLPLPLSLSLSLSQALFPPSTRIRIKCCSSEYQQQQQTTNGSANLKKKKKKKKCLRCDCVYDPLHNSPTACSFHGHITGEKGLFALAPPHQGIDGEWTDRSGVIVYKWNEKNDRPNTGSANWKKRWSCCSEYDENAPPCQRGWHVSYDDGFTMY